MRITFCLYKSGWHFLTFLIVLCSIYFLVRLKMEGALLGGSLNSALFCFVFARTEYSG